MKSRILPIFFLVNCFLLLVTACKEEEGPDLHLAIPTPANIIVTESKATKATINWDYEDPRAKNFTVELAANANFAPVLKSETVATDVKTMSFDGLGSATPYFVRVRALSDDPLYHSRFGILQFTSSEIESIFLPIGKADVTGSSVVLSWNAPKTGTVTHLVLTPDGGTALAPKQLSAAEVTAKKATITNLASATGYRAEIFDKEESKGFIDFSTKDINARITINNSPTNYETLQEAVNAAKNNDFIKFGPAVYDFSSAANSVITIDGKSLTLQADGTGTKMPEITLKTFVLKGAIANLKVSGLKIISNSKSTDSDLEKHIFGGTYITGVTNIVLENSDFSGAESGLFFTQTVGAASAPSPITGSGTFNLTVNNSLLHDFGNAGGDFIDFRSGTINKITFKNSSLWKAGRAIFRVDATAGATSDNAFTIENSTFNSFANGGAFIRVAAPGVAVQVNKNIIANKTSAANNIVSGTGTTLKFDQNNVSGSNAASVTSVITNGFNTGTTALDPGFTDAATGNFKVGNATLKAAAIGDPRWL